MLYIPFYIAGNHGVTKLLTVTVALTCSGGGLIGIIAFVIFVFNRWLIFVSYHISSLLL